MMEFLNVPDDVVAQAYKLASINLSPNVPGQVHAATKHLETEAGQGEGKITSC